MLSAHDRLTRLRVGFRRRTGEKLFIDHSPQSLHQTDDAEKLSPSHARATIARLVDGLILPPGVGLRVQRKALFFWAFPDLQ